MPQHVRDLLLDTDELALIDVTDAESAGGTLRARLPGGCVLRSAGVVS
jgi:hypothetical protein